MRKKSWTWYTCVAVLLLAALSGLSACDRPTEATTTTPTTGTTVAPTTTVSVTVTSTPKQTATPEPTATPAPTATPEPTAPSGSTGTPAPTATPEPTPTTVEETRLGFVVHVQTGDTVQIVVDYVEMFTGDEAIEKALEDGSDVVEMDEDDHPYIPNDYYIRNNNPALRTFTLADDCEVFMIPELGGPDADQMVSFEELASAVDERERLMTVEVFQGLVVYLEEFYLP